MAKPSSIIKQIIKRHKNRIHKPLYLVGPPGIGKTSLPEQAAKELGVPCLVIHAPLQQPEDYALPVPSADRTDFKFIVSKTKFPIEGSAHPDEGILVIDELPQADTSGQKILANLILAREIHGYKLKPGWTIVATGNRVTDRAGANRLLSHLHDRVTDMPLAVSVKDWTNWAVDNGVKKEVILFLNFKPDMLISFDPHAEKNATPRGWTQGVSATMDLLDDEERLETFAGDVGEGAAAAFMGYLEIMDKCPQPSAVIADPLGVDVPVDGNVRYASVGGLAMNTTVVSFPKIMKFIMRMPSEFQVLYIILARRHCNAITVTIEYVDWYNKHGNKVLT